MKSESGTDAGSRRAPGSGRGERTEQILRISEELFRSKGYSATTINDIAEIAGVLPGSLYHHFDSKAAIAVTLLEDFQADLKALVNRLRGELDVDDPVDRIRELMRSVSRLSVTHRAAVQMRAYAAPTVDSEQMSAALRMRTHSLTSLWRDNLRELSTLSLRPGLDLKLLRFAFQYLSLNAGRFTDEPIEYADQVTGLLLDGLFLGGHPAGDSQSSPAHRAVREVMATWAEERRSRESDERSHILEAARKQFATYGYNATTIREIAAAADIPMGSLYRRIESKEALLFEILTEYSESLNTGISAALDTPGASAAESIDALCMLIVGAARTWKYDNAIARFEWHHPEDPSVRMFASGTIERLRKFEETLQRGQEEGTIRAEIAPSELAPLARKIFWLPFQDHHHTSQAGSLEFIRNSALHGALLR